MSRTRAHTHDLLSQENKQLSYTRNVRLLDHRHYTTQLGVEEQKKIKKRNSDESAPERGFPCFYDAISLLLFRLLPLV